MISLKEFKNTFCKKILKEYNLFPLLSSRPGYKLIIKFSNYLSIDEKKQLKQNLIKLNNKKEKNFSQRISNIVASFDS